MGAKQPEALGLYERCAYERIPAFGEYVGAPFSVCFAKTIAAIVPPGG